MFNKKNHNKTYYQEHRQRLLKYAFNHSQKLRKDVLNHYGGKCACCGESRLEFLSIDHINGGGTKQRRSTTKLSGGRAFYLWLKREGLPNGFRVLCHNCNASYGHYKYCPHNKGEINVLR